MDREGLAGWQAGRLAGRMRPERRFSRGRSDELPGCWIRLTNGHPSLDFLLLGVAQGVAAARGGILASGRPSDVKQVKHVELPRFANDGGQARAGD